MKPFPPVALLTLLACTTAERAPIERKLTAALTDANLICLMASHFAGDSPGYHDKIVADCRVAADAAQTAKDLLYAADLLHLGDRDGGAP